MAQENQLLDGDHPYSLARRANTGKPRCHGSLPPAEPSGDSLIKQGCARFPEILQNFDERQTLWSFMLWH